MGVTITVDLANSTPREIARAAKFMLEFAGYQEPTVGATQGVQARQGAAAQGLASMGRDLVHPMGSLGEEVHEATTMPPDPKTAFAAGVGGNVTAAVPLPPVAPQQVQAGPTDATLPPPPPGIEVDAQGVPWDVRIHAGSRAKIGDGTWRQKRNLDPEVYKKVMDELRHTMGVERRAPQPPAPPAPQEAFAPHPPVPPVPAAVPMPPVEADDNGPVAAPSPDVTDGWPGVPPVNAFPATPVVPPAPFVASATPPAPPVSTTPPVPVSAGVATAASPGSGKTPTFPDLMKRITAGFSAKTITQPDIQRAVQKVGLTALPMLASRPDLIGDVATELGIAL